MINTSGISNIGGYGATAARLTPDQKVANSNLSGLILYRVSIFWREREKARERHTEREREREREICRVIWNCLGTTWSEQEMLVGSLDMFGRLGNNRQARK